MFRCVIVDDEIGAIDVLKGYIDRTPGLECTAAFRDSVEALNYIMKNRIDCLFLDIDMPKLSGLQISDLLSKRGVPIIFCTAYSEYAVESYEFDALDYLLKPIAYERFVKAVNKLCALKQPGSGSDQAANESVFLKSGSKLHQVPLDTVLYMKKEGHYIVFHTNRGEIMTRMNMDELIAALPPDRFIRVHKSYVIALDRIDTIERHEILIKGMAIPIGEFYRKDFLSRIKSTGS